LSEKEEGGIDGHIKGTRPLRSPITRSRFAQIAPVFRAAFLLAAVLLVNSRSGVPLGSW
jgi:hypothetical protein